MHPEYKASKHFSAEDLLITLNDSATSVFILKITDSNIALRYSLVGLS